MTQRIVTVDDLPESALDAAAAFHVQHLPGIRSALAGGEDSIALVLPRAGFEHSGWRKAAIADLARVATPKRVNAVAGDDKDAISATLEWLSRAPGITGQLLGVDGTGAGIPA